MAQKNKGCNFQQRKGPFHSLGKVKSLVKAGRIRIREQALETARRDFAWDMSDILAALKKFQPKHYHKTDPAYSSETKIPIDFYKASGLMGEDVYSHLYIDTEENLLIVDSFKRI